jgi:hypothetical protein
MGKPEQIALFRRAENKLQQPALRPRGFSNRAADNVPRNTLILFDLFHQSFGARAAAARYLEQGRWKRTPAFTFIFQREKPRLCPARLLPRAEEAAPNPSGARGQNHKNLILPGDRQAA